MNITYIIGNGFDLSKGFKTSYKDFYEFLNANKTKYSLIDDIVDSINDYYKSKGEIDWSDFEEGLVQYMGKNKFTGQEYKEKLNICIHALRDFLDKVNSELEKFHCASDNRSEINYPYKACEPDDEKRIIRNKSGFEDDLIIDVFTLNYTDICDKYFGRYPSTEYLHGRLNLSPIIIGADNRIQIEKSGLDTECINFLENYICKNTLINNHMSHTFDDFKNSLSETDLFVFYGISFGKTDEMLWDAIGRAIEANDAYVIVSCYEGYINPSNTIDYIDFLDEKRTEICNLFSLDTNKYKKNMFIVDSKKLLKGDFEL